MTGINMNKWTLATYYISLLLLTGCNSSGNFHYKKSPLILSELNTSTVTNHSKNYMETFCNVYSSKYGDDQESCHSYFYPPFQPSDKSFDSVNKFDGLKNDLVVALVPGIFGECLIKEVAPFEISAKKISKRMNVRFVTLDQISGRASSDRNAKKIHESLNEIEMNSTEKLIVIGYSKGVTDTLRYLQKYYFKEPVKNKISAFVSISGVVNGTAVADMVGESGGKIAAHLPLDDCPVDDSSGIRSLTLEHQLAWMRENSYVFKQDIPMYSLATAVDNENRSYVFESFGKKLEEIAGPNDGQVNVMNQILPYSKYLGVMRADHWAIILPFSDKANSDLNFLNKIIKKLATKNKFPREVALESILRVIDNDI